MTPAQSIFAAGLLSGNDFWPCAADLELDEEIERLAAADDPASAAWDRIRSWSLPERDREAELHEALIGYQRDEPEVFQAGMLLVYSAYYSHPRVLEVIEARCGYAARPPQPQGHPISLPGLDPTPSTVGAAPLWREDGTERARMVREAQAHDPDRIWTEEEISTWPM